MAPKTENNKDIHNSEYIRLLGDEDTRCFFSETGNIASLRSMYDMEYQLEDINAPAFWDARLSLNREQAIKNPMVQLRIATVSELVVRHAYDAKYALILCAGYGLEFDSVKHIPQVVAVDISPVDCSAYPNIRYLQADASEFVSRGIAKADLVLLLESIEHFQPKDGMKFLRNIHNSMNPGGRIIVSVPAREPLKENSFPCPCCGQFINPSGHLRRYSKGSLALEMKIAGFALVDFVDLRFGHIAVGERN